MPQGHCAPPARYAWGPGMAVVGRRALLMAAFFATTVRAQPRGPSNEDPLRALYGLAELQRRAATLAASRDTRPEVKSYAAEMAGWRNAQLPRLRAFLTERGILSPELTDDQRTVWDALATLDFLALTRRYAEVQLQSLELETAGYERATTTGDPSLVALANEMLPQLRQMLAGARRAHDAVKP